MLRRSIVRLRWAPVCVVGLTVGCASPRITIPDGQLPPPSRVIDVQTSVVLAVPATKPEQTAKPEAPKKDGQKAPPFQVPNILPGADAVPLKPLRFEEETSAAERLKAVRAAYPELIPASAALPIAADQAPLSLSDLQQLALANSPVIRRTAADADVAYGQMIQAGLHPNPTIGYQADQVQPSLKFPPGSTASGAGQQGGFVNQLIKTAGKLSLAQQVSGYDYINAYVAVRKAQVDVTAQVRTYYFSALVAKQSLEFNKALADMADEVYQLQLRQVASTFAARYEPYQIYAQAVQARNAMVQADATYRSAWKQLAAAVGQPDLPFAPLVGRADAPAPSFAIDDIKNRISEQHTDILTARNSISQANTNLILQKRIPIPDLQTNTYHQYDNAAQVYQFGVQLGIQLPISDRNQGNIRSASSQIASARERLRVAENDLAGRSAEAFARYDSNRTIVANYRDKILPYQTRAYQTLVLRWQTDLPGSVQFNDIVTTQQTLVQSIQAYLSALDAQWKAVVDLANISQFDDLYPPSEK